MKVFVCVLAIASVANAGYTFGNGGGHGGGTVGFPSSSRGFSGGAGGFSSGFTGGFGHAVGGSSHAGSNEHVTVLRILGSVDGSGVGGGHNNAGFSGTSSGQQVTVVKFVGQDHGFGGSTHGYQSARSSGGFAGGHTKVIRVIEQSGGAPRGYSHGGGW